MHKISVCGWDELEDRQPAYALVADVDLVIVRYDDNVSVLYGRCAHRGALMSDGHIDGDNLICGVPRLGLSRRHRHQRIQQLGSPAEVRCVD